MRIHHMVLNEDDAHIILLSFDWGPGEWSKGQISLDFNNKVNFKDFYSKLFVCSNK